MSNDGRSGGRAVGTTVVAALSLQVLAACPPVRLSAQSITVVAAPGFRTRVVHQRQFTFGLAVDTGAGGLVLNGLGIGAFTFTGAVRLDAAAPFARAPEDPGYADSARFESDGRVVLAVADRATRGPIELEARGMAGANAGRLLLRAHGWPDNRVLIITIDPLDLYVTAGGAGYGVRDRVRVDAERGAAFVSDSAVAPAVIAIGMGRGAHGRLQTGSTSIVLERQFDGAVGRERRTVNTIVLIVEPDRDSSGMMQAEIVLGLGRSEAEAWRAAQSGTADVPALPPVPRVTTPSSEVSLAFAQLAGAAAWVDATRAGTADTAVPAGAELWRQLEAEARAVIQRDYGRADSAARDAARFEGRLVRGLFGVREDSGGVVIAPNLEGAADDFTWRIAGLHFAADTLSLTYRPADRRAQLVVGALRRVRLRLSFPWLTQNACVTARRGPDAPERLMLVMLGEGGGYVDVRGAFEPALITVQASPCGS